MSARRWWAKLGIHPEVGMDGEDGGVELRACEVGGWDGGARRRRWQRRWEIWQPFGVNLERPKDFANLGDEVEYI
jgi:hypothetical protein